MAATPRAIEVCAAVIERDGRYLLGRRPAGSHLAGKWEFPGGKMHPGESREACILRELAEELGLEASRPRLLVTIEHAYPEKTVRLHFLRCQVAAGSACLPAEHDGVGWFGLREAAALDLAPADRRFVEWALERDGNGSAPAV
ncbi:MAG: CTP pyrophosphohydrolase [Lentisphaerae bacterium ADurb.BinA184]|nr:MAG: CTP pyrophosphohydrolase [Lentisphaerae bacterium ADurb.BinA184]